jgi:hypothetical protein
MRATRDGRRRLPRAPALLGALVAAAYLPATGAAVPPPGIPFSAHSPFNLWIPSPAPAATNTLGLAETGRSVNYSEYTPVVHVSRRSDPAHRLVLERQGEWGNSPLHGKVVHLPAGARGSADADGHLTIVIPDEDLIVSLYAAETTPRADGTWHAQWGGSGPLSGTGSNFVKTPGGRESGISQLAGLISPEDVRRGIAQGPDGDLGHALAVGWPLVSDVAFTAPAIRAGGPTESPDALQMGQRIYLDPALDVDAIDWTTPGTSNPLSIRFSKLVARTLQRYGAIIATNSPAMSFQLVHPLSWTAQGQPDPWPALIGPSAGGYYGFTVRNIPGSALRALPPGVHGVPPGAIPGATGPRLVRLASSFEGSMRGWRAQGGRLSRRRDARAPHGRWIGRVVATRRGRLVLGSAGPLRGPLDAGRRHVATAWVAAAGHPAAAGTVRLVVRELAPDGAVLRVHRSRAVRPGTAFRTVRTPLTTRTAGAYLDLRLVASGVRRGGGIRADRAALAAR